LHIMEYKKVKILLVDDEPDVLEILKYNLEKEGYLVYTASDGLSGKKQAMELLPDLIILDVMMPGMDGVKLCSTLRAMPEFNNSIIVLLTARGEEYSQIAGFNAGADDYIVKPVKPAVLMVKIKALLKRQFSRNHERIIMNNIIIEIDKRMVIIDNTEIHLPKKEFNILLLFASHPGKIFSREEIYQRIWGNDVFVGDRTLDVHIRKLREKLKKDIIKTVKGVGYGILD